MGASSFNEMEIDAIGEIMNISLGASATAVSTMLGTAVNITTPIVKVLNRSEFEFRKLEPAVGVEIAYVKGLEGKNIMMFSRNDVRIIVGMLMMEEIPEEEFEMDEMNRSAICEVMNQMMGSSATALSEFLGTTVDISTPVSFEVEDETSFKDNYFPEGETRVVVRFSLEIEGKLQSEFMNIMSTELAKRLLEPYADVFGASADTPEPDQPAPVQEEPQPESQPAPIQEEPQPDPQPAPVQAEPQPAPVPQPVPVQAEPQPAPVQPAVQPVPQQPVYQTAPVQPVYQAAPDPMMLQLLNQMQQSQMQMMEMMNSMKAKEAQRSSEPSLIHPMNSQRLQDEGEGGVEEKTNQEMLMKVPLEISVEIGRTKKLVKDILEFTQGSLVVLDKMAGEQADLYVNGQCIAKGDIVVVEDNFGIRITEIVARDLIPEIL